MRIASNKWGLEHCITVYPKWTANNIVGITRVSICLSPVTYTKSSFFFFQLFTIVITLSFPPLICRFISLYVRLLNIRSRSSLSIQLGLPGGINGTQLGSAKASHAVLLVSTQPGLLGVAEDAAGEEVDDETDDDADKGNGVQVVDDVAKDVDADDDAPKVGRQQRDVEKGSTSHTQDEGS